jgi:electron-transferring-flavoprotein dehydrogenase
VATGDMGVAENGEHKPSFEPGFEFHAKYSIFAEGCHGHLGKELISKFNLAKDSDPQQYGIGLKEVWEIPAENHKEGLVVHTAGYPLVGDSYAGTSGGFLYHVEDNQVSLGLIVDLGYKNPHLSPFDEFQKFKHHPVIKQYIEGGKRLSYGARALIKGGLNSLPKMHFPGGLLVGCDAGTLNAAKIKGSHTAMKSGMIAAETIFAEFGKDTQENDLAEFAVRFKESDLQQELHKTRNFSPGVHKFGFWLGSALTFIEQNILFGKSPFTVHDKSLVHESLMEASQSPKIDYPKPDGVISFDKLSSVFLSNTNHAENQPVHLQLKDPSIPLSINLPKYDEPAQRYCPAGVYEIVEEGGEKRFQINSQNCVHCKTCDIKDPSQNINWVVPEGGGGPNYPSM